MERAGFSTFVQAWDFGPGSNLVLEMDRTAREAQHAMHIFEAVYGPDHPSTKVAAENLSFIQRAKGAAD